MLRKRRDKTFDLNFGLDWGHIWGHVHNNTERGWSQLSFNVIKHVWPKLRLGTSFLFYSWIMIVENAGYVICSHTKQFVVCLDYFNYLEKNLPPIVSTSLEIKLAWHVMNEWHYSGTGNLQSFNLMVAVRIQLFTGSVPNTISFTQLISTQDTVF